MTLLYLLLGVVFGFVLSRSGAADYDFIQGMFLFTEFQLYGIIGSAVALTAPGVDVISAIPSYYGSNKYAATCGTSAAVPWVAGAIAVTKVARNITTAQAAVILKQTAVNTNDENPGIQLGSGRIDMAEAAGWLP